MINLTDYKEKIFYPAIKLFNEVLHDVQKPFEKPQFIITNKRRRWRYKNPKLEHVCILKAVRIVSSFNSAFLLICQGYFQECGVIFRTTNEFQQDIIFLLEEYPNINERQKMFVDEFLKENINDANNSIESASDRNTVPRKKIQAANARVLGTLANPHDIKQIISVSTNIYSGYVHGAYPNIMEMYGGPPPFSRFETSGMPIESYLKARIKELSSLLERNYSIFILLCLKLQADEKANELRKERNIFKKRAIEFGHSFLPIDTDPKKVIKELKR